MVMSKGISPLFGFLRKWKYNYKDTANLKFPESYDTKISINYPQVVAGCSYPPILISSDGDDTSL